MTVLSENVEDLLKRLETNSKSELNLIRALAEAIREVDDQTLRELRTLSLQHELRRESILGELQSFAARMCQLPARAVQPQRKTIDHHAANGAATTPGSVHAASLAASEDTEVYPVNRPGGDWRQAAQNIEDELDLAFGAAPRH